jgi:hypothetical protein
MWNRFDELIDDFTIPTLHCVSVLGPHLSFYTYLQDKKNLHPPLILHDPNQVNDWAPAEQRDTELMSDDRVQRLTAVANHVQDMVNVHLRQG